MSLLSAIDGNEDVRGPRPPHFRLTPGLALRMVISASLLAAAFWFTSDKLDWRQLARLDLGSLVTCAGLSLTMVWLLAWRWRAVTQAAVPSSVQLPRFRSFVAQTLLGLAANQVMPSVVVGDALRAGLLSRQGMPLGNALGSVLVDRLFGLVGLALLTGGSAFLLAPSSSFPAFAVAALVVAGAVVIALLWRLFGHRLRAIFPADSVGAPVACMLVALAMLAHLANIAIFVVVAHALGTDLPLLPTFAVMCTILLLGVLPISIAGWGVREVALIQALGPLGVSPNAIILSSVTYGLVVFVLQVPGFLMLVRRDRP